MIRFDSFGEAQLRAKDGQPIIEHSGQPSIAMLLQRSATSDAYLAQKIVNEWLDEIRPTLTPGVEN